MSKKGIFIIFSICFVVFGNKPLLASNGELPDSLSLEFCLLVLAKGQTFLKEKKIAKAHQYANRTLRILEKLPRVDEAKLLQVYLFQAKVLKKQKKYEAVASTLLEGIRKTASLLPASNPILADVYLLLGEVYRYLGQYKKALTTLEKSYALYQQAESVNALQWGKIHNMLGLLQFHFGAHKVAKAHYEKAIAFLKKTEEDNPIELGIALCNNGNLHFMTGKISAALRYFQQGGAILINKRADYDDLTRYYNGIGMVYRLGADYEKASDYYQKALEASFHGAVSTPRHTAIIYLNLSNCYTILQQFEQARFYAQKALTIFTKLFGKKHFYYAKALRAIARIENDTENLSKPTQLLLAAKSILDNQYDGFHPDKPKVYYDLTSVYLKLAKPQKALEIHEEGIKIWQKKTPNHRLNTKWLMQKAAILYRLNQPKMALTILNTALRDLNFNKYQSIQEIENFTAQRFINILRRQGQIYYELYQKEKQIIYLDKANEAYLKAIEILEKIRNDIQTESAKQFAQERYFNLYAEAMDILNQLYQQTNQVTYFEKAYRLAEQSKGLVLAEALEKAKLKENMQVPKKILAQERQLKSKIADYEKLRIEEQAKEIPNESKLLTLNNQIFYTKNDLYALQDSIATSFFSSVQIKEKHLLELSEIATLFPNQQTALIEYFVTDTALHSFAFYQDQYHWEVTKISPQFKSKFINYCHELTDFSQIPNKENSRWLAQQLLEKPLKHLPLSAIKKFIIIPDNYLGYLPFEALPSLHQPSNYLIEDFEISYAYAAHLLMQQNEITTKANKIWGGFAPTYDSANSPIAQRSNAKKNNNLTGLPGAQIETRAISNYFQGDFFIGSKVSENTFKKYAPDYSILHLSMHAEINDSHPSYSHFVFPSANKVDEDALTAVELSNFPLNAELAVLSACNTGFGSIKKGEGIMSLSRAFMYAGVPSTVMSLWKVPDAATSRLMTTFYEYLQQGISKDAALRQAKLDYLENTFSPEQRHPFYWAGFIATGNMSAVNTSNSMRQLIPPTLVSLALGLLGILFFGRKR